MHNFKFFLILFVFFFVYSSFGTTKKNLINAFIQIAPQNITTKNIYNLLGKPTTQEKRNKVETWKYKNSNTIWAFYWNKDKFEKMKFDNLDTSKKIGFDFKLPSHLESDRTTLFDAIKLLGTPTDMLYKPKTQEVHYIYKDKTIRIFFRERILVNYVLY